MKVIKFLEPYSVLKSCVSIAAEVPRKAWCCGSASQGGHIDQSASPLSSKWC